MFQLCWIFYVLLFFQFVIVIVFFLWFVVEVVQLFFYLEDLFGFGVIFVGIDNFIDIVMFMDYGCVVWFIVVFIFFVMFFFFGLVFLLVVKVDKVLCGVFIYKILFMWVYVVVLFVVGLIGVLLFDQYVGLIMEFFVLFGWNMQIGVNYFDIVFVMIMMVVWKQILVNFIFFLFGLQGILKLVQEVVSIDCCFSICWFWIVIFLLLVLIGFFLLIINIIYVFFDMFGIVDVIVKQELGNNFVILVYKVFFDGFCGNDLGGLFVQLVILMVFVFILIIIQFCFIEWCVYYI